MSRKNKDGFKLAGAEELQGKLGNHLGHFRQPKYLAKGHNDGIGGATANSDSFSILMKHLSAGAAMTHGIPGGVPIANPSPVNDNFGGKK